MSAEPSTDPHALQASEARYRTLTELSPDAILVNLDGRFVYANPAAARLVGADSPDALIGRSPFEFIEPEYYPTIRERMRLVLEEHALSTPVDYRWKRVDGSLVDVEVTAAPIIWDGQSGIQVVVRPVNERMLIKQAALASQEKYRSLFDSIDEGFCILEVLFDEQQRAVDYRYLEVNPAFEHQTGIKNAVGLRIREIAPNHEQHWFDLYGRVALTGESMRFEDVADHILDRSFYYEVYAFRVGEPEQRQVAVLFKDVTERRHMEQQRAELLQREQQARAEAEKAVALQQLFLGMISHELRTPLASIKGFSSSLLASDIQFSPEQSREFIGIIDQEADMLTDLIDQLLDAVRMQTGTLAVAPESSALTDIVERIMPQLELLAAQHQLRLAMSMDLPDVLADRRRIGQVLVNLIGNATKFSPPQTAIILTARAADQTVVISVSDEGIGIPPEERDRVFEVFQRLVTENSSQPGAGLGLAICKGIVEAHGGKIWIEDRPGPGTTVTFTLPIMTCA